MGILQVDPSQKKAVAVLLCVLALSMGVIVFRLQNTRTVNAAPLQRQAPTAVSEAPRGNDVVSDFAGNPFKKNGTLLVMRRSSPPTMRSFRHRARRIRYRFQPLPGLSGTPMPPAGILVAQPPLQSPAKPGVQALAPVETQPKFDLMATVGTAGKSFAVLRINDSQTKVVRVGDSVDGRFTVRAIRPDFAELTDGAVKVFAKRGHGEDGKTPG
jgi:hypothetical protein